ncbi:hypothetical protein AB0I72_27850 [Nocardiopsis sp. NPDC049922]|uniref:hypothetical protein n=1 Tax=Nocardiopsis sp. NPDC049922 TaxID=3155157 RepID=UPI0033DEE8F5
MVAELTAVSQLWVGSEFCARYILQQSERLTSTPDFWTWERTGEEASTWLLFAHKHDYLRALSNRFPSGATRSFCLPEAAVSKAPRAERILFLLTAALMESFGIRVQVSDEPAYGAVEGFVLNPGEQAIVANWLGSDGVWHVDMTDSTSTLREYMDVTGYARAHSVISADTSRGRLCSLAEYLEVNWAWLVIPVCPDRRLRVRRVGSSVQPVAVHGRCRSCLPVHRADGFLRALGCPSQTLW